MFGANWNIIRAPLRFLQKIFAVAKWDVNVISRSHGCPDNDFRWIWVAPPPWRSRLPTVSRAADRSPFRSGHSDNTEPPSGRAAPAEGPSVPRYFSLSLCLGQAVYPRSKHECSGGRGLLSVRSAAQLVLHRLWASLGRYVSGQEGPRAGPDATGWEEVLLPAQAGRLYVWTNRWATSL